MRLHPIGSVLCGFALTACVASITARSSAQTDWSYVPDLEVSHPPFAQMKVSYKERLDQPYVYVEVRGSYTETGRQLGPLHERMRGAGLVASGPPFGLYYDDPGPTPVAELRSRACFPIEASSAKAAGFERDTLPSMPVVYAVVSGPYSEVPRAYLGLFEYAARMGWSEAGPVREIYLVTLERVASFSELLCEVQLPVRPGR